MVTATSGSTVRMMRNVDWRQVVFVAAGVPALVLFSMGAISATIGAPAWLVWTISVLFGFAQSFTYAEIAGLHPSKTGGTAVHGATAWIRYSRILAPLSLWSNWLAWTPVLAIGAGLGAGYLLSIFFDANSAVTTWRLTLADLGFLSKDLTLRLNGTFFLGVAIMLVVFGRAAGLVHALCALSRAHEGRRSGPSIGPGGCRFLFGEFLLVGGAGGCGGRAMG